MLIDDIALASEVLTICTDPEDNSIMVYIQN